MLAFRRWNPDDIRRFIERQARLDLTYRDVGMTDHPEPPSGYRDMRHRVLLGRGEDVFSTARNAIQHWSMVPPGIAELWMPGTPVAMGNTIGMKFRQPGIDVWCACRVVRFVDERSEDVRRFGFAYGTLPAHIASGEGRYRLEWDLHTDEVWYEIRSLARPRFWPLRVLPFVMHRNQAQYHRASGARMQMLVRNAARLGEELLR